ncbi:hypothetical protein AJ80_02862 [Polytolypa hystricis UAMH7299]|uniref:Uncharacterized protein n=1 Tax=Polytolypa hystricis (strain UAMH7299) TaxID=1447883 RepID=A0A2B7YQC6_POLH7|nr:hypothetical protein AJ80_02862 [Polytolypa hystricis UAMH7299]
MNWTGGRLSRYSSKSQQSTKHVQKQHFAKARFKALSARHHLEVNTYSALRDSIIVAQKSLPAGEPVAHVVQNKLRAYHVHHALLIVLPARKV